MRFGVAQVRIAPRGCGRDMRHRRVLGKRLPAVLGVRLLCGPIQRDLLCGLGLEQRRARGRHVGCGRYSVLACLLPGRNWQCLCDKALRWRRGDGCLLLLCGLQRDALCLSGRRVAQ